MDDDRTLSQIHAQKNMAQEIKEFYKGQTAPLPDGVAPYVTRGYHKIQGPFRRHTDGPLKNTLIPWAWTREEFGFLKDLPWRFTEKVDGTNVRVVWDGYKPTFLGRTDKAQMPTRLLKALQETFTEELLEQTFGATPAILFGEGYGAGIQKGGIYRPDVAFILFDVWIDVWLAYENVIEIGEQLGIDVVPVVGRMSLMHQIRTMIQAQLVSSVAQTYSFMEGVVGTPLIPLNDRRGGRIIVKLKTEDLYGLALAKHITTISVDLSEAA